MQQFYKFITWRFVSLNVFLAPPRPSSGAYNCINSLWFYRWSEVVAALLVVVWPDRQAPDDGRGGARNTLSDTKRQVINL
jgi:hypothetical protein